MLRLLLIVSGGALVCSLLQLLRPRELEHFQLLHWLVSCRKGQRIVLASRSLDERHCLSSFTVVPCKVKIDMSKSALVELSRQWSVLGC